jgi:hypothetical protein
MRATTLVAISCLPPALGTLPVGQAAAGDAAHAGRGAAESGIPCPEQPLSHGHAQGLDRRCQVAGSSSGIARGDFNGDGFADLAIGVPNKDASAAVANSGAVVVVYGSSTGLTAAAGIGVPARQLWTQSTFGVASSSETGDRFGAALAAGDFNGDDFSDLAIGVPGEKQAISGVGYSGMVVVVYGSADGLTTDALSGLPLGASFSLADVSDGQLETFAAESDADVGSFHLFGSSLAWGDFDADGVGDLAVGAPRAMTANRAGEAGAVAVFYGAQGIGLSTARGQLWTQDTAGIENSSESGDRFGETLAAGDFNGDGDTDLVIGVPGEIEGTATLFVNQRGAVAMLHSRLGSGLTAVDEFWPLSAFRSAGGLIGDPPVDIGIGRSLATGDFNGDGRADLAVGAQFEDGLATDSGGVFIRYGSSAGLDISGNRQHFDQNSLFGSGNEQSDRFGFALTAGDFDGDGRADLAVGTPFEDVGAVRDAGAVYVIHGSATGLSISGRAPRTWHQDSTNIEDSIEDGDLFGYTLTAWNFGRNQLFPVRRFADLAIGVPFENVGSLGDAGAINVIYGSVDGLTSASDQFWTQTSTGAGTSAAGDNFGQAMY